MNGLNGFWPTFGELGRRSWAGEVGLGMWVWGCGLRDGRAAWVGVEFVESAVLWAFGRLLEGQERRGEGQGGVAWEVLRR